VGSRVCNLYTYVYENLLLFRVSLLISRVTPANLSILPLGFLGLLGFYRDCQSSIPSLISFV
jgi:hypothetical protein